MTREEVIKLCRYVKAACPQQAIDEFTPNVWFDLLGALDFADATEAVQALATRQPFVSASEIHAEVKRIRADRLKNSDLEVPAVDPADEASYRKALGEIQRRIGDGRQIGRSIESGTASEPSTEYRQYRDDLAERRLAKIFAENQPVQHDGPTCECGALMDPDGTCFACDPQAGAR